MSHASFQLKQVDSFLWVTKAKGLLDSRYHNLRECMPNCLLTLSSFLHLCPIKHPTEQIKPNNQPNNIKPLCLREEQPTCGDVLISVFIKALYLEHSQEPFRHSQRNPTSYKNWIACSLQLIFPRALSLLPWQLPHGHHANSMPVVPCHVGDGCIDDIVRSHACISIFLVTWNGSITGLFKETMAIRKADIITWWKHVFPLFTQLRGTVIGRHVLVCAVTWWGIC